MEYPATDIRFKYYGKHIELLIEEAVQIKDKEAQERLVIHIARLMKSFYLEWNRENIDEETLLKHLDALSHGKITLNIEKVQKYSLLNNIRRERTMSQRKNGMQSQGRQYYNNKKSRRRKA